MTKDEVEAMIEVAINEVKAEYQQTINELRDEIAALKGIQSAKVPLKSTPNNGISTPKSTLQIQNTEKEITNHIVTGSNTIEENNYRVDEGKATFNKVEGNAPDEVAPSNMGETGDVCDFQIKIEGEVDTFQPEDNNNEQGEINNPNGEVKQFQPDEEIKQSQATANKADQSLATPQMGKLSTNEREHAQNANKVANPDDEQQTIEYLTNLEMTLRDINTNLNHDEVIETSNELKATLDEWSGKSSHIVELATNRTANLIHWFTSDIITLEEVRDIFAPHLRDDNANPSQIARNIADHYKKLNPQDKENALIWTMTPQVAQISTNDENGSQNANKTANPASGNIDTNPQKENTPQTSENKASGSLATPQMGKLSTQSKESDQSAPESPTMAMTVDVVASGLLNIWQKLDKMWYDDPNEAQKQAEKVATQLARHIPKIATIEELNWCEFYANRAFEMWGRVLGTNVTIYYDNITRHLEAKRRELSAA